MSINFQPAVNTYSPTYSSNQTGNGQSPFGGSGSADRIGHDGRQSQSGDISKEMDHLVKELVHLIETMLGKGNPSGNPQGGNGTPNGGASGGANGNGSPGGGDNIQNGNGVKQPNQRNSALGGTNGVSGNNGSSGTSSNLGTQSGQGSTGSGGNTSNIIFHGGTASQQAQVRADYQKMLSTEGPYMSSAKENQQVNVYFDNTPGGMTTTGSDPGAKIELNSNLTGSELDAVAGHEFNNAYKSNSFNPGSTPNSLGYYPSEYIGDALSRAALGLPEDAHGQTVLNAGKAAGLSLAQMYQAYFGGNTQLQQELTNAVAATGVFNSTTN